MIPRNIWLPASLVLNVVLAVALLARPEKNIDEASETSEAAPPTSVLKIEQAAPSPSTVASVVDASTRDYLRALSEQTLTPSERASLLLSHLNRKYDQQLSAKSVYWRDRTTLALSIAAADQARADLMSLLGDSVWSEPALASLFQPYHREFPTLAAAKQVEVQRLLQQYFLAHEKLQADRSAYRDVIGQSYDALHAGVAKILTPSEHAEYVVRLSPLADSIRRMKLDLDEAQFRTLVQRIEANQHLTRLALHLEAQRTSLKLYDAQLADLLGKERYLNFISQIDPVYVSLAALARNNSIEPEKVREVYAAFVSEQSGSPGPTSAMELARSTLGASAEFIMKQLVNQAARS